MLYEGRVKTWMRGIWIFRNSAEFFRYVIPTLHSAVVCCFVMQRAINQYSIDPFLFWKEEIGKSKVSWNGIGLAKESYCDGP